MRERVKRLDGIRVLCVDDHQDSLTLLSTVLLRHGSQVTTCLSAAEAIAVLTDHSFDVVISDIMMPGMDGFDFVHELRKIEDGGPHQTPTIALSGQYGKEHKKKMFADFQIYLSKPFDRKNLVDVVERLAEAGGEAVAVGSLELWEADQANAETVTVNAPGVAAMRRTNIHLL